MSTDNKSKLTAELHQLFVEDGGRRRPYMRGIMIHSLMARGGRYEDALETAQAVLQKFESREAVTREELAGAVADYWEGHFSEPLVDPVTLPETITVVWEGASTPFSKGILSQSLLAGAIDPTDAYDVARDIERQLLVSGIRQVQRGNLRRRAYQALEKRISKEAAERYLTWRKYQEPADRPVILLLGGATGTGKTSLALEVAHRLGIGRVISTDSIRQVMRTMLSPDLVPALHTSSFDAHVGMIASSGGDPVIDGFHGQATTVSVGVRGAMDRAISENCSLVMDGVSLLPGLIDLDEYHDQADIIFLVVAVLKEDAMNERFQSRAKESAKRPSQRYLKHLDAIIKIQDHFLEAAERFGIPIVNNSSFENSAKLIIRHVTESFREKDSTESN
jgi:2-phosphoglycerate kinase